MSPPPAAPPGRTPRVRAPALVGRRWLGTGDLSLADLRGRVVLLHFWTAGCVNCAHAHEQLRPLAAELADVLVVVGVHSPKFPHEATPGAVDAAVARLDVRHAVLDDADLATWGAYAVSAWPTLVVVDPTGYVVATLVGEGHEDEVGALVRRLAAEHGAAGTLRRAGALPVAPAGAAPGPPTALASPGAVLALPGGGLLVSDSGHHQLLELSGAGGAERRRLGSGARGLLDGPAGTARFAAPAGTALLPPDVAARVGWDVAVADAGNHAVRGVRLADGAVVTVAGTGRQLRRRESGGPALAQDLATPQAVAWFDGQLVIAAAGTHQLWALEVDADPARGVVRVVAGTTAEGLRDGPAELAQFAQPSGLAADGGVLWLVDAESSALRRLHRAPGALDRSVPPVADHRTADATPVARPGCAVDTVVGTGVYASGDRDGPHREAQLQHPQGVALLPDGSVAVADTYNGAVRRYDPATGVVSTLARGLAEPAGLAVTGGALVVAESAAHRVTAVPLPGPAVDVAPGPLRVEVAFAPPAGQRLDARDGAPTRLVVDASPPELLVRGAGAGEGLARVVELAPGAAGGVLLVEARAATCDADGAHAACHLHRREWAVPVRVVDDGARVLALDLTGA